MKSRIRGRDAAWAAVHMAERRAVPLLATDVVGPFQPLRPCKATAKGCQGSVSRPPAMT
jgi:hypothetical protein